ncbi:MAG: uncharacterized protein QOH61_2320 [Chloroflexota bacterium]|jgi:predicted TIM-barrel fold metal-dependent hydrolase|nr:uncharacterized protein [Chloroflexota bacterium]
MTVVDMHTHLIRPGAYVPEIVDFVEQQNPGYLARFGGHEPSADQFVQDLRDGGVDRAVVLAEHASATSGRLSSEAVAEYCAGHPELIPGCCVNPNEDYDVAGLFSGYVRDLGFRVLKLLPSSQFFYPNDPRMYPVYALAEEAGVVVMVHVGSSAFRFTQIKYCDPIHLHEVARQFPRLKLLLSHAGRGFWYEQCSFMALHYPNVHLDIAGLPPRHLMRYLPQLERLAPKTVFGSDYPGIPSTIGANVQAIRELPLSPGAIEAILHTNAERLLGDS